MNKHAALLTTGLAAALALAPVTSAQAGPKYEVDFGGRAPTLPASAVPPS